MATTFQFDGKTIKIPSVRSRILSGIKNPPLDLDYGSLLIIDTGSGASWGGGAGISGEYADDADSIYTFNNIEDFRAFVKGGLWWLLAKPLFRPAKGRNGVSSITFIRAAVTISASKTITFTGDNGGSDSVVNGGVFTIKTKDEGLNANGVLDGTSGQLYKGYGVKMVAGVKDVTKYKLQFYVGSYNGYDTDNAIPYGMIAQSSVKEKLILESIEFNDANVLLDWMNTNGTFNSYFDLSSSTINGDGTVDAADLVSNASMALFSGATETYSAAYLTQVLNAITELNISFVLCDNYGANAQSALNTAIISWQQDNSVYKPEIYIAGYDDKTNYALSRAIPVALDDDSISVVHSGVRINSQYAPNGYFTYGAIYHAAILLGREAGVAPQVPLTFKEIGIDGLTHLPNDKEVEQGLDAGLLITKIVNGSFDCVKGVNSLQQSTYLVNEDGTTHSKQIKRIARQLNREIIVNAYISLLKDPNGVNRNTLSENDVARWLKNYLLRKIATPQSDNLILGYQDIVVTRTGDAYNVTYRFTPNSEISFLFFTGFILNI